MKTGYFHEKKYIIKDMEPVRPLVNYIWNEEFLIKLDHNASGFSFAKVGYNTRRTVIADGEGSRLVYLKDRKTGEYFCVNRPFTKEPHDSLHTEVGCGVQTVVGEKYGLRGTFTVTAPMQGYGELWRVEVENTQNAERELSLYVHAMLGIDYTGHCSYNLCRWSDTVGGLFCSHDIYHEGGKKLHDYPHIYFCADQPVNSFATSQTAFKGLYRTYAEPVALEQDSLNNHGGSYDDYPSGALELRLTLAPGEKKTVCFAASISRNEQEAAQQVKMLLKPGAFEEVLTQRKAKSLAAEQVFQMETGNTYMDTLVNVWLKNQIDLGKTWARVYGKGFRDVMQDVAAFVSFDPKTAREKILLCLSHQFPNGNTIRMFEPFLRYPYMDGAAWIPETVLAYLNESGNLDFLQENCPYFECDETGTVLEHIRRGMKFLTTQLGEHGLCLWGGGDWNDSINAAGLLGKGESVWLTIATVKALKTFVEILGLLGEREEAEMWRGHICRLTDAVSTYGWDGDHYIYGYTDHGEKVGSNENAEGQFYLNPQTWAVLAGIATGEKGSKLMDQVEARLHCPYGYVQCTPSYTKGDPHIGRASYFIPGCVENGSVYNHGVTFKVAADCALGRGADAYRTVCEILPDNPELESSGVEPYAMTNMYLGPENPYSAKFAPCSWITGTAGWMYRCITEYLLGVQSTFNGLRLKPCIPAELDNTKITRQYRGATYHIHICFGKGSMVCDGQAVQGDTLPIFPAGTEHCVTVYTN